MVPDTQIIVLCILPHRFNFRSVQHFYTFAIPSIETMSERIVHEGIIDHISSDSVFVRILSKSACAACHSNGICSVSEMTEKLVEVKVNKPDLIVGQIVNVILDRSLGNKAVVLGYLFPFLLMILTLLVASQFLNELLSGLLAIAVLIPYYFLLSLFKNRLSKTFSFHIEQV